MFTLYKRRNNSNYWQVQVLTYNIYSVLDPPPGKKVHIDGKPLSDYWSTTEGLFQQYV